MILIESEEDAQMQAENGLTNRETVRDAVATEEECAPQKEGLTTQQFVGKTIH